MLGIFSFIRILTKKLKRAVLVLMQQSILCAGILLLFSLLFHSVLAANASVNNIRLWTSPDKTRLVFDVSQNVEYQVFTLNSPSRLVIDIEQVSFSKQLPNVDPNHPFLLAVRAGKPNKKHLRFVLELKQKIDYRAFVLSPNELYGHRLIVDIKGEKRINNNQQGVDTSPADTPQKNNTQTQNQPSQTLSQPLENKEAVVFQERAKKQGKRNNKPFIVAIDAGHGGEDPGALGHRGSKEKHLTLLIAKQLKKQIEKDPRMKAFLVRKGDYYIKLNHRRSIARKMNADLFLSIHADAFRKKSARGLSVFALSQRGATSAMAQALAVKENASDKIGGVSLTDKDAVLKEVLVNLSLNHTIKESIDLGKLLIKELSKVGDMHSKRIEQAGFAVLKSADIPSLLIETGFITNLKEEKSLRTKWYRKKIAKAIYTAVKKYLDDLPEYAYSKYESSDTSLESKTKASQGEAKVVYHRVVRGDSLSKIAKRYGTTMAQIRRWNHLKTSVAKLGAKLKVSEKEPTIINAHQWVDKKPSKEKRPLIYTVKKGDSLSKISAQYNVKIRAIKKANNLNKNSLSIGQKLMLPGVKQLRSQQRQVITKKQIRHKVRRGDTLSQIAQKYSTSMSKIKHANQLKTSRLFLGQTLVIPE